MARFTLRPIIAGETFHRINQGSRFVGRVFQHQETKRWHARIGQHEAEAGTALEAFRQAGSKALGFEDHRHLQENNRTVRRVNRQRKQEARAMAHRLLAGDFSVIDDLLKRS